MKDDFIPEIVSINQLCGLMGVSRSRYYQLVLDGLILPPIYSLESHRAYFTREMAEKNISVIRNNCGLNGKICLFYNTTRRTGSSPVKSAKSQKQKIMNPYQYLIDGLACLGLPDVKPSQIESIVTKLYPQGVQNEGEGEVLKTVYRLLAKQNSTDNLNR